MKRIVSYGDSWTSGDGFDIELEKTITDTQELLDLQKEHSWTKTFGNNLGITNVLNKGKSGFSNYGIFREIIKDVENGFIGKDDFVTIMWSSPLRDPVLYFPNNDWMTWTVKDLMQLPERFIESGEGLYTPHFYEFLKDYRKFYINNIHNETYYTILSFNYVLFLQRMFSHFGIKYMMTNGIEHIFYDDTFMKNKFDFLDNNSYFHINSCIRYTLESMNDKSIWEVQQDYKNAPHQHPNKKGYEIVGTILSQFVIDNNLL